ncbi:Uncharacterised protein [Clostridium paraputrificum]|uniref:hypothetical protein n=1 Tax=Clostridium paraputrificum TaxID=29363 RepID=UPI000D8E93EC|nr:hypothetical protein [Clostridium paraputrificum]SQB99777.1 Uncharacterised protein [Clostridium paraputrificum]
MVFFKNADMQKVIKSKIKDDTGKIVTTFLLDETIYRVSLQPISEKERTYTWGQSIKSKKQIFCDESLNVNDLIYCKGKVYEIEDSLYNCYAIQESDVKINEDNK